MRAVIAAQQATVSTLVFATEKTGRAFNGRGRSVTALQRAAGVTFTPHDLRRTCRTLMSRLGVEHDIAELAIGHKRTGLDRLYNFDQAWQLRCDAFAKVRDHVATLIGVPAGPAVIPLRG
jgi:integrase